MMILLLVFSFLKLVLSKNFFVDVDSIGGNCDDNSNPGTLDQPFCTLNELEDHLLPGDTAYIRKGTYPEWIYAVSGNSTHFITWKNYDAEKPILINQKYGCIKTADYNIVDGVRCEVDRSQFPFDGTYVGIYMWGSNSIVRNCEVVNAPDALAIRQSGDKFQGAMIQASYNIIEDCYFQELSVSGIGFKATGSADTAPKYNIVRRNTIKSFWLNCFEIPPNHDVLTGNLIEDNYCEGSLISDGAQSNSFTSSGLFSRGYVIRNNIFNGQGENCIDLKGSKYFLVEGNICTGSQGNNDGYWADMTNDRNSCFAMGRGSGQYTENVIIRNNIFYDNCGGVGLYHWWAFYNNILHNNRRDYTGPNSDYDGFRGPSGNQHAYHINNFVSHVEKRLLDYVDDPSGKVEFGTDYNAFMYTDLQESENKTLFQFTDGSYSKELTFEEWKVFLKTDSYASEVTGKEEHSFKLPASDLSKVFVNIAPDAFGYGEGTTTNNNDFRMTQASPLLEKGGPLTFTTSSGSSSDQLGVRDPAFFYDGYGFEDGDLVIISNPGGGVKAEGVVKSIDFDNKILTLDRSVSWSTGDWVNVKQNFFYYDSVGTNLPNKLPSVGNVMYDRILGTPSYFGGNGDIPDNPDDDNNDEVFGVHNFSDSEGSGGTATAVVFIVLFFVCILPCSCCCGVVILVLLLGCAVVVICVPFLLVVVIAGLVVAGGGGGGLMFIKLGGGKDNNNNNNNGNDLEVEFNQSTPKRKLPGKPPLPPTGSKSGGGKYVKFQNQE